MQEPLNIERDGSAAEAALRAHGVDEGGREVEIRAEVLHHPDHEPRHFRVKREATLLEVLASIPTQNKSPNTNNVFRAR